MPALLAEFQRFEEERTDFFRKVIQDYMRQLSTMPPALSRSCDALNSVVEAVDAQLDVNTFVEANRLNAASIPPEIQYEPYDGAGASNYSSNITITRSSAGSTIPSRSSGPPSSSGGTPTKSSSPPKQWGLTGAESSLSQEEKRSKLEDDTSVSTNGEVTGEYEEEGDYVEVKARALFDYEAANDTELGFKAGDILTVTEQDESGWWYAELSGKQGFVPNNYLSVVGDE